MKLRDDAGRVRWRWRVAFVLLLCVAAVLAFGHLGDRLILWPSTGREDAHGAARFTIPFAGGELEIFRATSAPDPKAFVLRFYGNADRAERWVASETASHADRAIELWAINYPGYGGSTGPARLSRIADAALAAYDAARVVAGGRPIFVFGTSLGTTAALHVAAERDVAGLLLQNPPALRQLIVGEHGWWNLWLLAYPVSLQLPRALDSVANAARVHCPAVFLLAEKDEVVPPRYQRMVVDAFAGSKEQIVLSGARHNSVPSADDARRAHAAIARLLP